MALGVFGTVLTFAADASVGAMRDDVAAVADDDAVDEVDVEAAAAAAEMAASTEAAPESSCGANHDLRIERRDWSVRLVAVDGSSSGVWEGKRGSGRKGGGRGERYV